MKRFLCALMILCLVPVCAFCADLDDFNMYASIFGEEEIDSKTLTKYPPYSMYNASGCTVAFYEDGGKVTRIIVEGDGDAFFAYSMAAIMFFDSSSEDFAENAGQLLSSFLLCRNSSEGSAGQTKTGEIIYVEKAEKGYRFIVGSM